jgi:serine/threonine protein kinase
MSMVRSQLNKKPVLCKSSTEYDATENRLLEREYQILNRIYTYYEIFPDTDVLEGDVLLPIPARLSTSHRFSGDPVMTELVEKRIPFPIAIQKLENRNALLFRDTKLGPIDIGGETPSDIMNGLRIGIFIAQALDVIHKAKVLHLNVCPETILAKFDDDNQVEEAMLFDYRISIEIGKDSDLPNSIDENIKYISPEQTGRLDRSIDSRSDVYSLGITLWEIIGGRHPFEDVPDEEMVYSHIAKEVEPVHKANPLVPVAISSIIAKMIRKDPSERYQTMGAVIHDLESVWNHYQTFCNGSVDFLSEMQKLQLEVGSKDYHREIRMNGLVCGFDHLVEQFSSMLDGLQNRPSEVVFLKGAAKSGKLTLVQQFQKVVSPSGGHLCNECSSSRS